jgi:hypothetical protein
MALTRNEEKALMAAQIEEIKRHKWIESEKVGRDLGDVAVFDWIDQHAAAFRPYYSLKLLRQRLRQMLSQRLA